MDTKKYQTNGNENNTSLAVIFIWKTVVVRLHLNLPKFESIILLLVWEAYIVRSTGFVFPGKVNMFKERLRLKWGELNFRFLLLFKCKKYIIVICYIMSHNFVSLVI